MIAERNSNRDALNRRAQALLHADGRLSGEPVTIGGTDFFVGDRVITQAKNTNLRAAW